MFILARIRNKLNIVILTNQSESGANQQYTNLEKTKNIPSKLFIFIDQLDPRSMLFTKFGLHTIHPSCYNDDIHHASSSYTEQCQAPIGCINCKLITKEILVLVYCTLQQSSISIKSTWSIIMVDIAILNKRGFKLVNLFQMTRSIMMVFITIQNQGEF